MLTVGSCFAGIGGFDLGLERAGMRSLWQCEIDPYAQRVLARHWPDVLRVSDIRDVGAGTVPRVDVLCGGFPCQDLSRAGRREGIEGAKSGLWSELARLVSDLRPRYLLVENVPTITSRGRLGTVLGDLAALGYDAEWDGIPACAVGAPHPRDRFWLLAYPRGGRHRTPQAPIFAGRPCSQLHDWWSVEPDVDRVADGVPGRVERVRALGNALVPQIAEQIGRRIIEWEGSVT